MNYKTNKIEKTIAYFKISEHQILKLKEYSKIMKDSCKDILIKTNKDKNIMIIMCDLKFKPFTWADGVTVQDQNHNSTLVLEDKSEEDFMFYAPKAPVKYNKNSYTNVIMPVAVPPIADYRCYIHQFKNDFHLIEMRARSYMYKFLIQKLDKNGHNGYPQ